MEHGYRPFTNQEMKELGICHAPDASDEGRKSSGIGEQQSNGLLLTEGLIQLQQNSEEMFQYLRFQQKQIEELTASIKFLAEQVKTLVDALAEEEDTDMPMTNYLSGKPI